jgi:hypothetical protein
MVCSPKIDFEDTFKKLHKALSDGGPIAEKHISRATAFIGKKGEALIRQEISTGKFEPNKPLTVALKGGKNEPLKGDSPGAPLFKSIISQMVGPRAVFIGVLKTDGVYNIAVAIHDGASLTVTDKMRGMFKLLWLKEKNPNLILTGRAAVLWEKMPGGWKPLKKETKVIIIPPREFIGNVWNRGDLHAIAKKFWDGAVAAIFKEMSQT